jgi:hypothetical protein
VDREFGEHKIYGNIRKFMEDGKVSTSIEFGDMTCWLCAYSSIGVFKI